MAKEGGGDHSGGDNRRVRLTRGRSKGEEINRDRGHLANFLHTPGWSHPSQMKATADKKASAPVAPGPRRLNSIKLARREDKMQQLPCLHSKRGRDPVLPQEWEHRQSGPPSPSVNRRLRTRGSAFRPIVTAPLDITCNFLPFSRIVDQKKLLINRERLWRK